MKNRATVALGMLIVSASLALGGCGGGGSGRLTKAEFAARANALCTGFNKKIEVANSKNPQSSPKASLPLYRDEISSLKTLRPPQREQRTFDQAVALLEDHSFRVASAAAAMRTNGLDFATARKLARENRAIVERSDTLFTQLGAKECTLLAQAEK
ncbi:MAG: hypothetical protein WBQ14_01735 [Gaiellaceae bacterium]